MAKKKKTKFLTSAKTFILVGDILHAGRVQVNAKTFDEALKKAEAGDFVVFNETSKGLGFEWNGDDDTVEVYNEKF